MPPARAGWPLGQVLVSEINDSLPPKEPRNRVVICGTRCHRGMGASNMPLCENIGGLMACFRVGLRALICALFSASAFAQTAQLSGYIKDPSGASVPAAAITITNKDTGAKRDTKSSDNGLYVAPLLQPGSYQVLVEASGFQSVSRTGVTLGVEESARLDFTLQVGQVQQAITVEEDAAKLNTTDGSVGMTVSRQLVDNLPLNGRSIQQLITLAPGVNLAPATSTGGQFTVNGQRPTANYLSIDGASANIGFGTVFTAGGTVFPGNSAGGTNSLVSVDAVEEFRILTSTYAPEYGRTPGGQVIIRTRSGTNEFHGAMFEYFRNNVLDANNWFANANRQPHPPLRFNDFGGVVGGPIFKNKTFFFLSYEGQRIRHPQLF